MTTGAIFSVDTISNDNCHFCIAGVGPDGWLENWHLPSGVSANVRPGGVERAARFGLAMLRGMDAA